MAKLIITTRGMTYRSRSRIQAFASIPVSMFFLLFIAIVIGSDFDVRTTGRMQLFALAAFLGCLRSILGVLFLFMIWKATSNRTINIDLHASRISEHGGPFGLFPLSRQNLEDVERVLVGRTRVRGFPMDRYCKVILLDGIGFRAIFLNLSDEEVDRITSLLSKASRASIVYSDEAFVLGWTSRFVS